MRGQSGSGIHGRRRFVSTLFGAAAAPAEDEFGGWAAHTLSPSGRFRLENWRSRPWLVTPAGHPLLVAGLCHAAMTPVHLRVRSDTTTARFGDDKAKYARDLLAWMRGAGFNTFSYGVPEGTTGEMNRFAELGLVPGFINGPQFPDLFDPVWRTEAARKIAAIVPQAARDARVIGYVLSNPLLFSPTMERAAIWRGGEVPRQNYLTALKALPAQAPGQRAYREYLRQSGKRGGPADSYETLHPDDTAFYQRMWSDLTAFFVKEIRRHDPVGLILSYRFIRVVRWPDPWLEAMLRGVGPHVDAFAPELYAEDPYGEVIDGIGRITGKPALIMDGMRLREFVYAGEATDTEEADAYVGMMRRLTASPWFLGGCICEYRQKLPNNPHYSPRPRDARTGIRNPDYSERPALLAALRKVHQDRYRMALPG